MRRSYLKSLSLILSVLLMIMSVSGVYAIWKYYSPASAVMGEMHAEINQFMWDSEEVLPDDDNIGESHYDLMNDVLNGKKYGLNGSDSPIKDALIIKRILNSKDKITGGNLKNAFATQGTKELEFVFEYIADDFYYFYTFADDDLNGGIVDTTRITVYKTKFSCKDDVWYTDGTLIGTAIIRWNSNGSFRTIYPSDWVADAGN